MSLISLDGSLAIYSLFRTVLHAQLLASSARQLRIQFCDRSAERRHWRVYLVWHRGSVNAALPPLAW